MMLPPPDQHVDASASRDDIRHAGLDVRLTRDIHGKGAGALAGAAELVGRIVRGCGVAVGNHHRGAGLSKGSGDFLADATRGTGDDGDFALKLHSDSSVSA
jgi:hypothetical protein